MSQAAAEPPTPIRPISWRRRFRLFIYRFFRAIHMPRLASLVLRIGERGIGECPPGDEARAKPENLADARAEWLADTVSAAEADARDRSSFHVNVSSRCRCGKEVMAWSFRVPAGRDPVEYGLKIYAAAKWWKDEDGRGGAGCCWPSPPVPDRPKFVVEPPRVTFAEAIAQVTADHADILKALADK